MRKTRKENVTVQKEVVSDIFCDKCGESMHLATVKDWVQVEGGDGCCDDFFSSLKHKPEVTHGVF